MQDSVLPQGCGGGVAPHIILSIPSISFISSKSLYPSIPFIAFIASIPFIPSKSLTQVGRFWGKFGEFSPVENFFELSTSYQQIRFFDAVLEEKER